MNSKRKRYIAQLMQKKSPLQRISEKERIRKKKIEKSWSCKPISSRVRTSGFQSIKVVCVLLFVLLLSLPHDLIRIKHNWKIIEA